MIAGFDIEDIAHAVCRGGWPEAITESNRNIALGMVHDYVTELLDSDIEKIDDVKRNKNWMRSIIHSYARNVSSKAPLTTIAADRQGEPPSIDIVSGHVTRSLARA